LDQPLPCIMDAVDRRQLADFLRRRREDLQPQDVGLLPGQRRRAAGLRREEVAALTGMSTDYYTRLEQARGPQPSEQMLAALARSLRLTTDEPALQRVLDRLEDTPALIISSLGETLRQNALAVALMGDHAVHTGKSRSGIYRWFTDPGERAAYPVADQPRQGRALVASLRAAYGIAGERSRAGDLVRELQRTSPEFAELWERHEVAARFEDHKTLVHPEVGDIELDCQALLTEDQSQALLVLTAAPRSEAEDKLRLLAVIGHHAFSRG
jgi:transcriptional regulator with XRE-family HTH domain